MKILFHILLDMNQKTKISTKFPRSKLGVATVVLSLGGVAVYSLGVINPLQASKSEYLQVDGVQNSVQYLTSLVIDSPTAKVEFKYDDASKAVRASGSLNMQNLVVGQGNESSASSVVFWWTENDNQWANSVIVWGNNTTNKGKNNVIVLSPGSKSSSENTTILNGQNVVTTGKNITVVNGENANVSGNYVTVFGNSSVDADHVVVFGDKVNNNKSNTFVFNGQDAEFVPEQESAFYANSKVAINGDHANATLDVHGGMMIGHRLIGQRDYTVPRNWDPSGIILLFSGENKIGLCGYDGKANRRVPLSESARKFWLCAPMWNIWDLPEYAVSNNPQRSFPQVWNQNKGHWDWESPKWIYGSKDKPQHFLCKDGFVPDNADPIGKTGVKCTKCEWAKSGDLNCTTQKADNSAATPHCPQDTTYNETSKKCEGTKSTPCVAWDNIVSFNPDTQIETYNADTWIWEITQKCEAEKCQEGFTLEGKRCVPAKCQGQLPENAIGFTGAWNVQWSYDKNMEKACSFKCDDSSSDQKNKYFRIEDNSWGGSCKRCADGQYNAKIKKCVKGVECRDGYQDDGSGKCKALMECLTEGKSVRGWNARYLENYRPFGTHLNWTYTWGNLQPNSCQFTCAPDEVPHRSYNLPHCIKRGCYYSNSYASGVLKNLERIPETGFNDYGSVRVRPAYWAKTLDDFNKKYKDKPGCRERCPGLDEHKEEVDGSSWPCLHLRTLKNWSSTNNSDSDKKNCWWSDSLLGDGWDKYKWSPSQSMYRIKKWNSSRWSSDSACTAYCSGNKITGEELGMKDKTREYCLKKTCGKDEWLNEDWICKKCHPGNIPDSDSVKISWYPTKCKYPCKEDEVYISGKCEKASVDKQCPEGWTLENNKCVSSPTK